MSKGDAHNAILRSIIRQDYDWAGILGKSYSGTEDNDPLTPDCSGMVLGASRQAGVRYLKDGKWLRLEEYCGTGRPTSRTLAAKATPIDYPDQYGDLFFLGHPTHHVGVCDGRGYTIEAGYHSRVYYRSLGISKTGSHHVGRNTVQFQIDRGAYFGRLPSDLGQLSTQPGDHLQTPAWPTMQWGFFGQEMRQVSNIIYQAIGGNVPIGDWWGGKWYDYDQWLAVRKFRISEGLPAPGGVDMECLKALVRFCNR